MIRKFQKIIAKIHTDLQSKKLLLELPKEKQKLIKKIRREKLTYLSVTKLISIGQICNNIKNKKINGAFIEAGCALGGSTILISKNKPLNSAFYVYDVFGMIPPPTEEDTIDVHQRYETIVSGKSKGVSGDTYYGYQENLYDKVLSNLKKFHIDIKTDSVILIKGLIQDTMQINEPIAFAHIDVDWYSPVKTCLERIAPNLVNGGSIVLDDYNDWGGCKKAVDEFMKLNAEYFDFNNTKESVILTKIK